MFIQIAKQMSEENAGQATNQAGAGAEPTKQTSQQPQPETVSVKFSDSTVYEVPKTLADNFPDNVRKGIVEKDQTILQQKAEIAAMKEQQENLGRLFKTPDLPVTDYNPIDNPDEYRTQVNEGARNEARQETNKIIASSSEIGRLQKLCEGDVDKFEAAVKIGRDMGACYEENGNFYMKQGTAQAIYRAAHYETDIAAAKGAGLDQAKASLERGNGAPANAGAGANIQTSRYGGYKSAQEYLQKDSVGYHQSLRAINEANPPVKRERGKQ